MHEALAEKYVRKALQYTSSDRAPLPGSAEQLAFALVSVAWQRDEAEMWLRELVGRYSEMFMRTADPHAEKCRCLRCLMDDVDDFIKLKDQRRNS